jgi:transaldolase
MGVAMVVVGVAVRVVGVRHAEWVHRERIPEPSARERAERVRRSAAAEILDPEGFPALARGSRRRAIGRLELENETMTTNAERVQREFGQSLWYDNLERGLLRSGAFRALVAAGVRGCTSNPTIFEKAIRSSSEYDPALRRLVSAGQGVEEIYYDLVVADIQAAADELRPVYDGSEGRDGYISVEVQPRHAGDTQATVKEALELVKRIARPNLMIKVPATEPGLAAIRTLIGQGISVNVTLIFGVDQYRRVAEAYVAGLEQAQHSGLNLSRIASVASFFVSRLDTLIDGELKERMKKAGSADQARLGKLLGKAAIANAKRAYVAFGEIFSSARFGALAGAQRQRVLWASTGTKDPAYPDTLYVDELIGPDTVNTLPPATLTAFQDHGHPSRSVDRDVAAAEQVLTELESVGVSVPAACERLLQAGVTSFATSLDDLFGILGERRAALLAAGSQSSAAK